MERYQRGHQQPVGGARPVGALLVLACAVVAVAAAVWGLNAALQRVHLQTMLSLFVSHGPNADR